MKNKFSISGLGILLLVGLLQSQAMALGLGEIELKSALNQPFNATIQLTHTGGLTEDEIITNLAARKDFENAGVDRIFFLTELKFGVYIESDTSGVIHITTRNPVDEPYLDFIIETQWPTGRMLREYTVLLDPPAFIEAAADPVKAPVVRAAPAPQTKDKVDSPADSNVTSAAPASGSRGQSLSANDNGVIQTTDETLWEVALKARPSSEYSVQQTMMAIQDQNPRAFMKGNINLIKQHQKIKVPTPEQIRSRSLRQAERDVAYQNKMFSEGRRLPTKPRMQPLVAAKSNTDQVEMASGAEQAELKLVSASEGSTDQAAGGAEDASGDTAPDVLKNALAVSEENLDKSEQEKLELSNRMAELEKNLETMQKLLTLKDEQMALLQAEVDKPEAVVAPSEQAVLPPAVEASEATQTPEVEMAEQKVNEESVNEETPAPVQSTAADSDWLSGLKNSLYLWGAAAVFAVLVLVLIFRKKNEANAESDVFESDVDDLEVPLTDSDFNQEGLEDITGFDDAEELSEEFVPESLPLETPQNEVKAETSDVLAEADIYLAYGRAQPAIDILSSAIKDEPARIDLRIKLLEIHADQNDSVSFDKALAELTALDDETANQQAAELRTRMVVDDEVSGDADDLVFDLYQEDESNATAENTSTIEPDADAEIAGMDFDLSDPAPEDNTRAYQGEIDLPDLSFENTESDQVVSSLEKSIAEHESKDEKDIGEIDFDIDMDDFDLDSGDDLLGDLNPTAESELPSGEGDSDEEDADLDSINMQMRIEAEAIVARIQEQDIIAPEEDTGSADDLDSLHMKIQGDISADLDIDIEDNIESDLGSLSLEPSEPSSSFDEPVDDQAIITADESETKIDLAQAYVEMEDFEGARELLKEVLQEGTAEQKKTVEQMLASIS